MQSANLESTYYIIKHAFNDPKISQTFFVPLGLAALIYAFFLLIDYSQGAIIGILAAIGLYMLYRGFSDTVDLYWKKLKDSFYSGRMAFFTYTAAAFFIVLATLLGLMEVWSLYTSGGIWYYGIVPLFTTFINRAIWLYVLALLFADAGKIIDCKQRGEPSVKYMIPALFVLSLGFLFWGATNYLISMNPVLAGGQVDPGSGIQIFVYSIVIAIILSLVGIRISNNPQATGKKPRRLNDAGKKK
jgi:putative membrane protein